MKKIFIISLLIFLSFFGIVHAANNDFFLAPKNSTSWQLLDQLSEYFEFKNTSSVENYFIPTKTSSELQAFLTNKPADVLIRNITTGTNCSQCPSGTQVVPFGPVPVGSATFCNLTGSNLGLAGPRALNTSTFYSATTYTQGEIYYTQPVAVFVHQNQSNPTGQIIGPLCAGTSGTDVDWVMVESQTGDCTFDSKGEGFWATHSDGVYQVGGNGTYAWDTPSYVQEGTTLTVTTGSVCGGTPVTTDHLCSAGSFSPTLPSTNTFLACGTS